jgi:uncharacterized protein YggE
MKHAIILSLMLIGRILAAQAPAPTTNQLIVLGSAELKSKADQATFFFSVKGVGSTLRHAVEDADAKTRVITGKLVALGIGRQNMSTSEFYSGDNTGDMAFLSSSRDFKATLTTVIKLDSLELLQPALFLVSEQEVQSLSEITFALRSEVELRRRARIEAAQKAREKAEDLAKTLGVNLGPPISIEEEVNQSFTPFVRGGRAFPSPFNSSTNLSEGVVIDATGGSGFFAQTISVSSQVRVVFQIK